MSKKIMKRSLALGALMAFVITGSAMAGLTVTETSDKVYYQSDDWRWTTNVDKNLDNKEVVIESTASSLGLLINDKELLAKVNALDIISGGGKTGLYIDCNDAVVVNAPITLSGAGSDARIEVMNGSEFTAENIISNAKKGMVQVDGSATANLRNVLVKEGTYFSLQSNKAGGDSNSVGQYVLGNVTVEKDAQFRLCVYGDEPAMSVQGDIAMTLKEGAVVDFGAQREDKADWLGNKMKIDASTLTVNVEDTTAKVYLSTEGTLENENIKVIASANNNTGDAANDLNKIAGVVSRVDDSQGSASLPASSDTSGVQLTQEASNIFDAASGIVSEKGTVENISVTKNSNAFGVTENNALSLMSWRSEMNDMNKRMGELRNAEGQHGVWVRMVRGEAEYESVKNQYNQYQFGYDEKLSVDPSWTVGVAFNYTEGDTSYSTGSAENKNTGFSVYGSKLNDDGSFIDLIVKYARLENDFKTTMGDGDYSSNGYSVSAEYGKRIQQGNGLWVEPQVELTYGKVGSANYKMGTVDVAQDSIESLVGRVGFSLGKNISKGNVYARASYLYDFEGETAANFADGGKERTMEQDLGGGWWEVGVGANINLSKATYIYADVEKTFGGEVDTNWQWNLGVRYSF